MYPDQLASEKPADLDQHSFENSVYLSSGADPGFLEKGVRFANFTSFFLNIHMKMKLECTVHGVSSQISTLKFLTPQHPQVPPQGHDPSSRRKILFNIFSFICENMHKVWYENL